MLREILVTIGIVELVAPESLIEAAEHLALENPEECERKPWVIPVARVEGAVFLVLLWRSDSSYATFKKLLGPIGIPAFLLPRLYIDYAAAIAYRDASTCQWKSWVYPFTRLVGVLYVILALAEWRRGRRASRFTDQR